MKKERIFYLDFIRAIAVISILLTHYNATFLYMQPQRLDKVVITWKVCNLYIGDFGVSLFFIISGAALMYVYEKKCELLKFYKKRLIAIYPMFWITYVIAFVVQNAVYHRGFSGIPKQNFLLTILGFDSYYAGVMPTFYLIGEWFLGCIILVYVLFSLLRWGVNKHPGYFTAVIVLLYLLAIYCYATPLSKSELVAVRIPEVFFGMMYMKYFRNTNWKAALFAIAVLIANTVFVPGFNSNIQTTYVGIMAFLVLTYIGKFVAFRWVKAICSFLSKYSYAIFLTHHYIIYRVTECVDYGKASTAESYGIFAICVVIILPVSMAIYYIDKGIKAGTGKIKEKVFAKNVA